jgi:hypothetical protein
VSSLGTLIVVGTGIQWGGQATLAARRAIEVADRVLFAVADPGTAQWILALNPAAESLPYAESGVPRRRVYEKMVERILAPLREGRKVVAVFYGHPGVLSTPAHEAIRRARAEGFVARMLPGVSSLDCLFADLGVDPGSRGCQMFDATDFLIHRRSFDVRVPLVLWQITMIGNLGFLDPEDRARVDRGLSMLSADLCERYTPRHEAVIYDAAVHPLEDPRARRTPLERLVSADVSDTSTLYVPPVAAAPPDAARMTLLGMATRDEPSRK